jgi:hypothetical protein
MTGDLSSMRVERNKNSGRGRARRAEFDVIDARLFIARESRVSDHTPANGDSVAVASSAASMAPTATR